MASSEASYSGTTTVSKSRPALGASAYGKVVLTLKNCVLSEEKIENTPSNEDGLDKETEIDLRILGCELIQTAGILLKLPQVAMATGQILFHRFYYTKSFVRHPMETTAMGCVCLASKIEEAPRKIRDVINVFHHIKQVQGQRDIQPMILDQNYINLKAQVIKAERRVLKELGFCVHVSHPHKIIVMYLQVLGMLSQHALIQKSWNYMNDALRTVVFVRYQPETIACACIYLTARELGICLPKDPPWFAIFRVTEQDIKDVCFKILRLYKRPKPNIEALEQRIEELRVQYQEARLKARSVVAARNDSASANGNLTYSERNKSPGTSSTSPYRHRSKRHEAATVSPRRGGFVRSRPTSPRPRSRTRSRSLTSSPRRSKHKKLKKHRRHLDARSRSAERKYKKYHRARRSYSRSQSASPRKTSHKLSRQKDRYHSRS